MSMKTTVVVVVVVIVMMLIGGSLAQNDRRMPPKIIKPSLSETTYFEEGTTVILVCEASGVPAPTYKWYYNGDQVTASYPSSKVSHSPNQGNLTIAGLSTDEEGEYRCQATNTFSGLTSSISATARAPPTFVYVARVESWNKVDSTKSIQAYSYLSLPCGPQLPTSVGPKTFKWFFQYQDANLALTEIQPDERIFIDRQGTLHFAYALQSDDENNRYYACALSSAVLGNINLGGKIDLNVMTATASNQGPTLQYSSDTVTPKDLTFNLNEDAHIECFYSGYTTSGNHLPQITWQDNAGQTIISDERYSFLNDKRVLVIKNVNEADETMFTCIATNAAGQTDQASMTLNVTSSPIWVKPLTAETKPQGQDALFNCDAKSMPKETPPYPPLWFKNGEPMINYDTTKYVFSANKKLLRIVNVTKVADIACFQCEVENSEGTVYGDACLNVLLPIVITTQPPDTQVITQGDVVNLTVTATSDPLYALSYRWHFKNRTYSGNNLPPHVTFDPETLVAYINTSGFSDEQMRNVTGVYRREVYHVAETKYVDVTVSLQGDDGPATAGFPLWIIGLILGLLILIIILVICCCVICRRKMQEGDYPVDKKETAAGLDPEKEVKESAFPDLSRATTDPYEKKPPTTLDIDGQSVQDDDSFGSAEYGEEPTAFTEDGSFIGVYQPKTKPNNTQPEKPEPQPAQNGPAYPNSARDNPAFHPGDNVDGPYGNIGEPKRRYPSNDDPYKNDEEPRRRIPSRDDPYRNADEPRRRIPSRDDPYKNDEEPRRRIPSRDDPYKNDEEPRRRYPSYNDPLGEEPRRRYPSQDNLPYRNSEENPPPPYQPKSSRDGPTRNDPDGHPNQRRPNSEYAPPPTHRPEPEYAPPPTRRPDSEYVPPRSINGQDNPAYQYGDDRVPNRRSRANPDYPPSRNSQRIPMYEPENTRNDSEYDPDTSRDSYSVRPVRERDNHAFDHSLESNV